MNKVFNIAVRVSGGLQSTYVFTEYSDAEKWLDNEFLALKKEHVNLKYGIHTLEGLKVGDQCLVVGEGSDKFIIEKLIQYSPHRYGFVLDSGWSEEVQKCYVNYEVKVKHEEH